MRASLFVAALLLSGEGHAHAANRSSCAVDAHELDALSGPRVHISCEIPVASEAERATLTAAVRSLVRIYAQAPHDRWQRECVWVEGPRIKGHHEDALVLEADARCPDNGSVKMDLAYLAWHPAPHVAEVSIGNEGMLSTSIAHSTSRIVTLRDNQSTRLFVGGLGVGLVLFMLLVGCVSPERSRSEKKLFGLLIAIGVAWAASSAVLHW